MMQAQAHPQHFSNMNNHDRPPGAASSYEASSNYSTPHLRAEARPNSTSPFPHHAPILPMPTTTSSNTGSSPPRNLRKRKTPPPQESPSANTSSQSHHSLPHYDYPSSSADHYVPPVGNFSNNNPAGTTGELHPINMNPNDTGSPPGARPLSTSKRAEQNRKAQRAFRERRDQHVKALEQRSQMLDVALASADEANRRFEDCRQMVDNLRVENATLKAALAAYQSGGQPPQPVQDGSSPAAGGSQRDRSRSPRSSPRLRDENDRPAEDD